MKINVTKRNIRKFTALQGKKKRVSTITDDYGNQVHVIRKKDGKIKTKSADKLYGAKKQLKNDTATKNYSDVSNKSFKSRTIRRHLVSADRRYYREKGVAGNNYGKDHRKMNYHSAAKNKLMSSSKSKSALDSLRKSAQQVHGLARKSRKE